MSRKDKTSTLIKKIWYPFYSSGRSQKMRTMVANTELPIDADILKQLHENHYTVIDEFLPQSVANQLLDDAEALYSDGSFSQHYFQFGEVLLKKPNVFEIDLSDPNKVNSFNNLGAWKDVVEDIGPAFLHRIDKLDKDVTTNSTTNKSLSLQTNTPPAIKVQLNSGGGSFPWHYDNPGPPNNRKLTVVMYLNPSWSEGDGGEIILCPFLSKSIVIPPLHRRAVFFYSDRILHRVLPSKVKRVCFTMWFNGSDVNTKEDVVLSKEHLKFSSYDDAQCFFTKSPLQRVISRAVYADEYLESLLQCIGSNNPTSNDDGADGVSKEDRLKVIKQHEASVQSILSKLRPLIDEFRRRKDSLSASGKREC